MKLENLKKQFIDFERADIFTLHLQYEQKIIPCFIHNLFTKSAQLYLQDMYIQEFGLFDKKGYFTVRRTKKFISGTWTDMVVEQNLMRSMKCVGGLTHDRGISETTVSK